MFLIFLSPAFLKKAVNNQNLCGEAYNTDSNSINSILLTTGTSECRADVYFNKPIYPSEVKLMRGIVGGKNTELVVASDLLEHATFKNNQKTISVPLKKQIFEDKKVYSIKIADANKAHYTQQFSLDSHTGKLLLELESRSNDSMTFDWFNVACILLACVVILLLFVALFKCISNC